MAKNSGIEAGKKIAGGLNDLKKWGKGKSRGTGANISKQGHKAAADSNSAAMKAKIARQRKIEADAKRSKRTVGAQQRRQDAIDKAKSKGGSSNPRTRRSMSPKTTTKTTSSSKSARLTRKYKAAKSSGNTKKAKNVLKRIRKG